ncbi:MAG: DUF2069 domain-containing protein [Betaproteobacteria bacterium]
MQNALPPTIERAPGLNVALQRVAIVSLIALLLWCVVWEIWFAPLRPGGTLLFLKALPLAFAVRGVARGSLYTIQWASMLVLLYLMEGVVRAMSDPPGPSISAAWVEVVLSSIFFFCSIFYVRPAKRAAKAAKKLAESTTTQQSTGIDQGRQ